MSEVMSHHSAEEAPFITGPLQIGDELVGLREPGLGGVGKTDAVKALRSSLGENWRKEKLTDDDKRRRNLVRLVVKETVVPPDEIIGIVNDAAEIENQEVHGIAKMTQAFVPELRKMLIGAEQGVEVDAPLDSQLMRLLQVRIPEAAMYDIFSMATSLIVATPKPNSLIVAAEERGHEAQVIGKVIEEPVVRIHSPHPGRHDKIFSYDI